MKEPTASALAAASGISILSGTILGLPAEAMLGGFGGGLAGLAISDQPLTWARKVSIVALGTVSAAYFAPIFAVLIPVPATLDAAVALKAASFAIGFGAQNILPALVEMALSWISSFKAKK